MGKVWFNDIVNLMITDEGRVVIGLPFYETTIPIMVFKDIKFFADFVAVLEEFLKRNRSEIPSAFRIAFPDEEK